MEPKDTDINQSPELFEKKEVDVSDEHVISIGEDIRLVFNSDNITEDQKREIISKALDPNPLGSMDNDNLTPRQYTEMEDYGYSGDEYFVFYIDDWIKDRAIAYGDSVKESDIRKLFSATFFANVNKIEREKGKDEADKYAKSIFHQYSFDTYPTFTSRIGSVDDEIDLISIARRGSISRKYFAQNMEYKILADNVEPSMLLLNIDDKQPIEQMHYLDVLFDLTRLALSNSVDGDNIYDTFLNGVLNRLDDLLKNRDTTPLVQQIVIGNINKLAFDISENQEVQPENTVDLVIAPGIKAEQSNGQIDVIIDESNNRTAVSDWHPEINQNFCQNSMFLIEIAHRPNVQSQIESVIGIGLAKIPLETQIAFLHFAVEASNSRYDKLTSALSGFSDESEKLELINAFMSLEFGDEFGDRLLTISDKLGDEESLKVFKAINEIRSSSKKISESFKCSVEGLDSAMQVAWLKRTTEILAVLADYKTPENEVRQAIEALDVLQYASKQIEKALDGEFRFFGGDDGHRTYKTIDEEVTVTARTSGTTSQRVAFKVGIPSELTPSEPEITKKEKLSIRLDHDDKYKLALDVGSTRNGNAHANASNISHFIADQMEKGEKAINGKRINGNHVSEAFDGRISDLITDESDFTKVVNEFVAKLRVVPPLTLVPGTPDGKKDIPQSGGGVGA